MGKPSAPRAPDPVATAQAQTASNKETAVAQTGLNAINQYGPQGSVTYAQNGKWSDGTPRFTQTTSLSPTQQAIFNTGQKTQQNLANLAQRQSTAISSTLAKPVSLQTSLGTNDYSADRQKVEDALMGRLNTQLERDRGALEASLANRGIRLGSEAYQNAQDDFSRGVAENRTSAILNAGQEQYRLQNLALNAANFGNSATLQERNQALNENIGLATGTQVGSPSYAPTPQTGVAGTDIAGITANNYNGQLNAYGQQMGQWNSTMGGLFGLGANALLAFSDKRLKTDIKDTGERVAGVPVKEWTWKATGKRDRGVIAQELERKHPEMVDNTHPSGFKRVDYGGLMRLGATAQARAA